MTPFAIVLAALVMAPPPAWIQRVRFTLELARTVHGTGLSPTIFSR